MHDIKVFILKWFIDETYRLQLIQALPSLKFVCQDVIYYMPCGT